MENMYFDEVLLKHTTQYSYFELIRDGRTYTGIITDYSNQSRTGGHFVYLKNDDYSLAEQIENAVEDELLPDHGSFYLHCLEANVIYIDFNNKRRKQ